MMYRRSALSAAIVACLGLAAQAHAQDTTTASPATGTSSDASELDTIVVTGIRGSVEKSLDLKREAKSHVEVVTAEDIGKMPDKNVADSLQRLPGVTISSAGATEGGFDENDRVSMRGTNPSLTMTSINGHPVSSGDWFVLNQSDNAGRSVSYTLMPSELVSKVVVHKTSQASLAEGGVTGTVDMITRKPLEFANPFTGNVSVGGVYSDRADKTDAQFSGLLNWKNQANTFGVLLQVFDERRSLRRDGVEVLGYDQFKSSDAAVGTNPDLLGVWYPRMIGAAFFEQKRERQGGLLELQLKPTDNLSLDLSAFSSDLKASNYNRNYLMYSPRFVPGQSPLPGYVIRNNTLVSADYAGQPGTSYGLYDMIARPDEKASTKYLAFEADWQATEGLNFNFKLGNSTGHGETPTQDVAEWTTGIGTGASWDLNGIDQGASFTINDSTSAPPANLALDWIFGLQNLDIEDKDKWGQVDAEYKFADGVVSSLQFGLRSANHDRTSADVVNQGPNWAASPFDPATFPQGYSNYPSDFASGIDGNFPRDIWYFTSDQMHDWNALQANRDPIGRRYPGYEFDMHEESRAAYVQLNLEGERWNGDIGLRYVTTSEDILNYTLLNGCSPLSCGSAGINPPAGSIDSAWGWWAPLTTRHDYTDVLPSANFKFDISDTLVARIALTKTMARPDYSALAGALSLSPPGTPDDVGGGSASNPDLKPVRSTNFDASLEWYYAPRSLLAASLFYMDLSSYVSQGTVEMQFPTFNSAYPDGFDGNYLVTVPVNAKAKAKGLELTLEQPIGENFGISSNYTYTDASESDGDPVVGASKNVFNLSGYYENEHFSARLAYNYRSHFYSGLDRRSAFNQDDTQSLSASLGWTINQNFSVTFDAMNLTNEKLKYYALNKDQPRAIYENGRQYYFTFRAKF